MHLVGLTGGIGSGKSTVSELLRGYGHEIIDADVITREVQSPGQPTLAAIVATFGEEVLRSDGTLDRPRLAARVFTDPAQLALLNAIVHPVVGHEINRRIEVQRDTGRIVILDVPLLVESGRDDLELLVVVDTDPETAVRRLIRNRGFTEDDARARINHQVSRSDRLARADIVIPNDGTVAELTDAVVRLNAHLTALRD